MKTTTRSIWRKGAAIGAVLAIGLTASAYAGHAGGGDSLTGCLKNGMLRELSQGDRPAGPCMEGETEVHLSYGDVTGVEAGIGLLGGGQEGDVPLRVDPSEVQSRVTGTCTSELAGSFGAITEIRKDGTVVCDSDDVGTGDIKSVQAGFGLLGGG